MNAIELFCGAGGTSLGAVAAGVDVRLGLDFDSDAVDTFAANHPHATPVVCGIENVSGKELLRKAKLRRLDLLIGGPSCQGYSTIGKRIADDPRNNLYIHYLRIVEETKPRWILFENVRGMLATKAGSFYQHFVADLRGLGYHVVGGVVNAADYGVPQRRERVIVVGSRTCEQLSLPLETHDDPRCEMCSRPVRSHRVRWHGQGTCPLCEGTGLAVPIGKGALRPWVSVQDAIGDLPWLSDFGGVEGLVPYESPAQSKYQERMRRGSKGITLHVAKRASAYAESFLRHIGQGQGLRSLSEEQLPARFKKMRTVKGGSLRKDCTTLYYRLGWTMPAYTITCYFGNVASGAFVHPEVNRSLTVREAARLQSYPDRFAFSRKNVRRQIGNAVPPLLAERLVRHILALDDGQRVQATRTARYIDSKPHDLQKSLF